MRRTRSYRLALLPFLAILVGSAGAPLAKPALKVPVPVEAARRNAVPLPETKPPASEDPERLQGKEGQGARESICSAQEGDRGRARPTRYRLVRKGLPRRRRATVRCGSGLADHAPLAQPRLGPSQADQALEAARHRSQEGRLARPARRRHRAAARRPDDLRARKPPGRARCRHLAQPHARPRADLSGARGHLCEVDARQDAARRRPESVHRQAGRAHQARRLLPEVQRIFVHPAIKKALCERAGKDRGWLAKVRPLWGHHYHFHIRIYCPNGGCRTQAPVGGATTGAARRSTTG